MYLVRTDGIVGPGRAAEFEKWWAGFGPLLKPHKGFQLAVLFNSLGYPARYTSLTRWDNVEAFRGFFKGGGLGAHIRAGTDFFTLVRPQEAYELVYRVGDPSVARGNCGILVEFNINPRSAQAFESSRKEVLELRQKLVKGFVVSGLWRSPGTPTKYLVTQAYTDRKAAEAARTAPEVQAFMRAHPFTEYADAPPTIEAYELVQRIQP